MHYLRALFGFFSLKGIIDLVIANHQVIMTTNGANIA
jgi:hypothetical protein